MGRARGANSLVAGAFETTTGTTPTSGFFKLPIVSHSLGEESPLIDEELLGLGREPQDPTADVKTNAGDVVVPVDVRNFGYWLKLMLGAPTTTGTGGGPRTHVFTSGAATLPSMSIEIGAPEVPAFATNYGARGNSFTISLARSGLLNATCGLICMGESDPVNATVAGTPTAKAVQRFAQATGAITKDGTALGAVVGAELTFSNQMDPVETIKADGRIEDSDPGMVMVSGKLTTLFKDTVLLAAASANPPTPIALTFGWTSGAYSLLFTIPRVFLPKPKRPISGPRGIQADFNWKASGSAAASLTATLINDVTGY